MSLGTDFRGKELDDFRDFESGNSKYMCFFRLKRKILYNFSFQLKKNRRHDFFHGFWDLFLSES